MASRPLHFIFIADCSGSMYGAKIRALNNAIREALPHMREVADENPNARVLVRAIAFGSGARWHHAEATPVEAFQWQDLDADGVTDLGAALRLLSAELRMPPMPQRALPPVLVLVSDGQPTDDWEGALGQLLDLPWGTKAVRVAIAIGEDADTEVLQRFIHHPELRPLQANSPEALVRHIKWASTAVLKSASAPPSQALPGTLRAGNVPIPALPPAIDVEIDGDDVW